MPASPGARHREFALPDLGEGLTEGEILQWLVAPGDQVTLNQPVVEVETAKAAVELPSPFAGVVTELLAEAGQTVDVGSPIIRFDTGTDGATAGDTTRAQDPEVAAVTAAADLVPTPPAAREAVLVGYGVRAPGQVRRRPRAAEAPARAGAPGATPTPAAPPPLPRPAAPTAPPPAAATERAGVPLAKPPVRRLAKDLGVDLAGVRGSGPGGVVTRSDVEAAAGRGAPDRGAPSRSGEQRVERRIPIKGVRKATAAAMVSSAFTAPHVTLFLTTDLTETMALVERWRALPDFAGLRVGPLLVVMKALLAACARHPEVNASWDEGSQEIVIHPAVNLGIAAATPRGLLVPNIKDADRLSTVELARALGDLVETARSGRSTPADLSRGTITITNVGSFGVDNGTPILNPGEAAILCFGAVRQQPWVHEGALAVRWVTQLALSFDHRLVDGQLGSQVLADIGAALADPTRLLAWS